MLRAPFEPSFRSTLPLIAALALGAALIPASPGHAASSGATCAKSVARSLSACVSTVNNATRSCYLKTGAACAPGNGKIATALGRLTNRVLTNCPDATTLAAAGFPPLTTSASLVDRLHAACRGEAATLAARTFGGPEGVVLSRATQTQRACLEKAHTEASLLISQVLSVETPCARAPVTGGTCDVGAVKGEVAIKEVNAATNIAKKCGDLEDQIGTDIATYVARTTGQVHCLVANAHGSTGALEESCGPRPEVVVPARSKKKRITLEHDTGARCGNGSRYAFWIRLAPEGQPVDRVVIHLQGGGICTDEASCAAALVNTPNVFEARRDRFRKKGVLSNDPAQNPFANWTKVFLPNCGQDAFTGGGAANDLGGVSVQRFGGHNLRAALARVRDVLWTELDATSDDGYRPDRFQVLFGGSGSGGYGVAFNLHHVLDELRWTKTVAVVDSSVAPDNGGNDGIGTTFPSLLLSTTDPAGWAARSMAPPYALPDELVTGPALFEAHAARLDRASGQALLNVSNQVDDAQVAFGKFAGPSPFVTAVRSTFCTARNTDALRFFLPANLTSSSSFLNTSSLTTATSGGVTLATWLAGAANNPTTLQDLVEEGALGAQLGVPLISCLP